MVVSSRCESVTENANREYSVDIFETDSCGHRMTTDQTRMAADLMSFVDKLVQGRGGSEEGPGWPPPTQRV